MTTVDYTADIRFLKLLSEFNVSKYTLVDEYLDILITKENKKLMKKIKNAKGVKFHNYDKDHFALIDLNTFFAG